MRHVSHVNESCPVYNVRLFGCLLMYVHHSMLHTYEWVNSHIWMSHVPHMNKTCPTYVWAMSHIWMRHVPHITRHNLCACWRTRAALCQQGDHTNESCPTYVWVMSHIWACLTCERIMSHIQHDVIGMLGYVRAPVYVNKAVKRLRHVPHMNESCPTYVYEACLTCEWIMSHM